MELAIQLTHINTHTFSTAKELMKITSALVSQKLKPNKKRKLGIGMKCPADCSRLLPPPLI